VDVEIFGSTYPCLTILGCNDNEVPLLDFCLRDAEDQNYREKTKQCFAERRNLCKFRCTDFYYHQVDRCSSCSQYQDEYRNDVYFYTGELPWSTDVVREIFIYDVDLGSFSTQVPRQLYYEFVERELYDSSEKFRNIHFFPKYQLPLSEIAADDEEEIEKWHKGIILPVSLGLNNRINSLDDRGHVTIRVRCPNRSMAVSSKCSEENHVQSQLLSLKDITEMPGVIFCAEGICNVRNLTFYPKYPMTSIVGISRDQSESFLNDDKRTKSEDTQLLHERVCNECGANYVMILTNSGVNDQHQYHGTVEEVVVVESWPTRTFAVDPLLFFHMCPITCEGSDKCVMFGENCQTSQSITLDDPATGEMAHRVIYHRLSPDNVV